MVKLRILHYLHKLSPGHHKSHEAKESHVPHHDPSFTQIQRSIQSSACPDTCVQRWSRSDSLCSHQNRSRYVDLGPVNNCYANHPDDTASCWMTNLNREQAEKALRDRLDGTFLVRRAANGQYALSLVCNGCVVHCIIYQENGFFGFAAPFQYLAIEDLISYYMSHSLENHNPNLRTRLIFPAFEK